MRRCGGHGSTCGRSSTVGFTLSISRLTMWIIPLEASRSGRSTVPFLLLPYTRILLTLSCREHRDLQDEGVRGQRSGSGSLHAISPTVSSGPASANFPVSV